MKSKLIIAIISVLIVGVIGYGVKYLSGINRYKNFVNSIEIQNVDLSQLNDGKYTGKCDAEVISAEVEITVNDNKIEDIELLNHKNERGKAAESVVDEVIKEQKLTVDTVSGATNSSKVILKAIENALEGK